MKQHTAVVTGMGGITPLGLTVRETWHNLIQGRSGVRFITYFDPSGFDTRIAAEVKHFDPLQYIDRKEARRMDRFCQFAMAAAAEAVQDAGLHEGSYSPDRVGVIVGSGIGGMATFESEAQKLLERGPHRVSPFFIPMLIPDLASGHISMRYGFRGPNFATVSACASSANALAEAMRIIRRGEADVVIAGGSEAPITPLGVAGFNAMKALSERNDAPEKASRPFEFHRDGFVMGEGAGIVVVESEEHAKRRGARIYAKFAGAGLSADAYHITAPAPEGGGAQLAMQRALADAGLAPEQIGYINAHGTSTPANDKNETIAISRVFGDHAGSLHISSTKSMIGHLLGASGAVEAIATIMTLLEETIHPTINYETPDPDCNLNYTPNQAVKKQVEAALSNSFGFGGHNVALAFCRYKV